MRDQDRDAERFARKWERFEAVARRRFAGWGGPGGAGACRRVRTGPLAGSVGFGRGGNAYGRQ